MNRESANNATASERNIFVVRAAVGLALVLTLLLLLLLLPSSSFKNDGSATTSSDDATGTFEAAFYRKAMRKLKTSRRKTLSFKNLCNLTAGRAFLDLWRAQRVRETLSDPAAVVDTYEFPWHEYTPTVKVCYDCVFGSIFDKEYPRAGSSSLNASTPPRHTEGRTYLRFHRYMPFYGNPYEGFHAIFSAFVVMKLLSLSPSSTQLVFLDTDGMSAADTFLWSALSDFPPLMVSARSEAGANVSGHFARVVTITSSTATSLLCTKDRFGVFKGRGIDHHCGSPLFGELVEAIRAKAFNGEVSVPAQEETPNSDVLNVIWSQRRGTNVKRKLHKEAEFLSKLQEKLDDATRKGCSRSEQHPIRFNVTAMDFAATPIRDVIRTTSTTAHALVGIHGAGLLFSAFLTKRREQAQQPPVQVAPLLVELFARGRGAANRHYHNMVSLLGLSPSSTSSTTSSKSSSSSTAAPLVVYRSAVAQDETIWGFHGLDRRRPKWYDESVEHRTDLIQWGDEFVGDVATQLLAHFCDKFGGGSTTD